MFLFILACLYVMAAALVLEATSEEGVLVVSPRVWLLILAALGVWLLVLVGPSGPAGSLTASGASAAEDPQ